VGPEEQQVLSSCTPVATWAFGCTAVAVSVVVNAQGWKAALSQASHCGQASETDLWTHGDTLATQQREQLVVIQQGVHTLNPQCVHGSIKQDPLLVRAVILAQRAHDASQHTVLPLMSALIKGPVQLIVGQSQWVDHVHLHLQPIDSVCSIRWQYNSLFDVVWALLKLQDDYIVACR